ncbi:hypothetical protein SGLAD_v1c08130 [Spiroplasma gladiatoris]|uniref:Transmembrane protein n=1 Tax=Spiroplasma gladiatoris TaxID=2143 RepID=A0A4P7AIC6_9MOLU|nr:hypothetical protein [Spiroplasma gladiatoris]QBQ08012.1 hypothetical protein SGLAD_v1c08130 [Spiroplasma gladiatoris]
MDFALLFEVVFDILFFINFRSYAKSGLSNYIIDKKIFRHYLIWGLIEFIIILIFLICAVLFITLKLGSDYVTSFYIYIGVFSFFALLLEIKQASFSINLVILSKELNKVYKIKFKNIIYVILIILLPIIGYFINIIYYNILKKIAIESGYSFEKYLKNKKSNDKLV